MTADDYECFAEVWGKETVDRPGGLYRRRGEEMEYLSLPTDGRADTFAGREDARDDCR